MFLDKDVFVIPVSIRPQRLGNNSSCSSLTSLNNIKVLLYVNSFNIYIFDWSLYYYLHYYLCKATKIIMQKKTH